MSCVNSVWLWRLAAVTLQMRSSLADGLRKTGRNPAFFFFPTVEGNFHHCQSFKCISADESQHHWARQHLNGAHAPRRITSNPRHKERSMLFPDSQASPWVKRIHCAASSALVPNLKSNWLERASFQTKTFCGFRPTLTNFNKLKLHGKRPHSPIL